jgi:hypothetical protein
LTCAFNSFNRDPSRKGKRIPSRLYEYARKRYIEALKANDEWKRKMAATVKTLIWIKRGEECNRVTLEEFPKYAEDGWTKGRIIKHRTPHSDETKAKIGSANKGKLHTEEHKLLNSIRGKNRVWMNNGTDSKHVEKEQVKEFESRGYVNGRIYTQWNDRRQY